RGTRLWPMHGLRDSQGPVFEFDEEPLRLHPRLDQQALLAGQTGQFRDIVRVCCWGPSRKINNLHGLLSPHDELRRPLGGAIRQDRSDRVVAPSMSPVSALESDTCGRLLTPACAPIQE